MLALPGKKKNQKRSAAPGPHFSYLEQIGHTFFPLGIHSEELVPILVSAYAIATVYIPTWTLRAFDIMPLNMEEKKPPGNDFPMVLY